MPKSHLIAFIVKEVKEALPAIVFFAIGFNLIELTTQLLLDTYSVQFANFTLATLAALFVGKAVLLTNALPFFRRFDTAPLIRPILYKTVIYWLVVGLLRFLERLIEYWAGGGTFSGIPDYVAVHFPWHRFLAVQIWIFTLFLIYTTAAELSCAVRRGRDNEDIFDPQFVANEADKAPAYPRACQDDTPDRSAHARGAARSAYRRPCRNVRTDPRTFDA